MPTLYSEGYIYYGKTHRHPNSTFQYTVRSNLDLFTFDEADNMDLINQPLLMIAGDKADTLYMTQDAFKKATGTNNKELYLVKGLPTSRPIGFRNTSMKSKANWLPSTKAIFKE